MVDENLLKAGHLLMKKMIFFSLSKSPETREIHPALTDDCLRQANFHFKKLSFWIRPFFGSGQIFLASPVSQPLRLPAVHQPEPLFPSRSSKSGWITAPRGLEYPTGLVTQPRSAKELLPWGELGPTGERLGGKPADTFPLHFLPRGCVQRPGLLYSHRQPAMSLHKEWLVG